MRWRLARVGMQTLVLVSVIALATAASLMRDGGAPPARALAPGSVSVAGSSLAVVDSQGRAIPATLDGINGYQFTSEWGLNAGCGYGGWTTASLAHVFEAMHPGELVRTWLFQSMASDDGHRDWGALDRVVAAATAAHVHLIATLANQNGQCDDGQWKDTAWYSGGFATSPDGVTSYRTWVQQVVSRYAHDPTVAIWEPVNEPEPTDCAAGSNCYSPEICPDPAAASTDLLDFFTDIGGLIHYIDPTSLVSDGGFGGGNCGTTNSYQYRRVVASPGIDIDAYHDYSGATTEPADLAARTAIDRSLGKPMMVGEAGVTGCGSAETRAADFEAKMRYAFSVGVSAYVVWWYSSAGGDNTCDSPIDLGSPTWALLARPLPPPLGRLGATVPTRLPGIQA